ncbi:CYTH and CHAD domain-containing protein [Kribbella solani]|uniref:CYTH and CHAD domain-containing protein n=1 Tax=Kribbella solani TaxID=236067 RepID=UPI0029B03CA2|nr:CYTH and CHAD domain-containing protein [Kribbella solani]MDX2969161.1 CYTH and CHAD domain-containing protein [Kribbella solani]
MAPTEQLEIETKYDVDESTILPALHELPGVASVAQPVTLDLEATYYDTAELDLAANKVTLRRRTGGEDDGWHVKFPGTSGGRLEVRHPLDESAGGAPTDERPADKARRDEEPVDEVSTDEVPAGEVPAGEVSTEGVSADEAPTDGVPAGEVPVEVVGTVRVLVRDRALEPVVTLRTRRVVHRLLDADGGVLAEFADDRVTATVTGGEPESWREWEVELVDGDNALLEDAGELLLGVGARPASGPSKLARALGDRVPSYAEWTLPNKPLTSDLFRAYAGAQVNAIRERDPEVRRDVPDSIHKFRVATRRLRSALATYRPVIDRAAGDEIRAELKWLAGELGAARDAEVQREHFAAEVAEQPVELVIGRVAGRIDDHLRGVYQEGRAAALAALESERYFRLLDALDELIARPPVTTDDHKAKKQIRELLHHDYRRMRKAVRRSESAPAIADQDHALHEVRKAAKRLRYAAESAVPVLAEDAATLAARAEEIQEVLGEHQDSVVSRDLLYHLSLQVFADGGNTFTYGRLHAAEESRATTSRAAFYNLWPTLNFHL